ncbi:MAG: alpha/beta hydrolase [Woeseiaceae bacterium]|nr:alpha/beta hydrolase [Woeseiaceae bacterium]
MASRRYIPPTIGALAALMLAACAGNKPAPDQIFLMPAPDVYEEGEIDPFIDNDPISRGLPPGILYATDRAPAAPDDRKYENYTHERGFVLRVGRADTRLGHDDTITWEEARRISLLKNRTSDYPLEVVNVEEFGIIAETIRPFDNVPDAERSDAPKQRFLEEIDRRLGTSPNKDVYIYVHGYKVNFENPLLVAAELWHFLGYQGAFIAYSWPTKFSMFAYLGDLDNAINSARNLRALVVQIALGTDVERIHVIGYSMGTRLVARMLADLGIYASNRSEDEIRMLKLENVILIGSDMDRAVFGGYLLDGALRVPRALTVYQSAIDGALGMSQKLFSRERVGQFMGDIDPDANLDYFYEHPEFRFINVTEADAGEVRGGHGYFRKSPWVSSDMLMTLLYNLPPEERGLVRYDNLPAWHFPPDYVDRLRRSLAEANPKFEAPPTRKPRSAGDVL